MFISARRTSLLALSLAAAFALAGPAQAAKPAKAPAAPAKAAAPQEPVELTLSHQLEESRTSRLQEVVDLSLIHI